MSTKIATAPSPETSLQGLDTVLPVSRREIFWRPKYLAASGYLEHLPVLFWLAGDLRPGTVVTLGGGAEGSAVAHLALCQAVERLGLDADCTGLNTWPGEIGSVADYADTQYGEFARLVEVADDAAPGLFEEGGIDLLVVDRDLDAGLLKGLGAWADRLGDEACLVLRGTEAARRDPELSAALDAFRGGRPVLRFPHGGGVWVMAAGKALPARLERLAGIEGDRSLFRSLQQVFQRLGAACANEWAARDAARVQAGNLRELEALRPELDRLSAVEAELGEELVALRAAHAARATELERVERNALEAGRAREDRIAALESELARNTRTAEAEAARLDRALETAEGELAELRAAHAADLARLERELAEARADTGALDALEATRREETARFTALLAERDGELSSLREAAQAAAEEAQAARAALTDGVGTLTALLAESEEREAALSRELAERPEPEEIAEAGALRAALAEREEALDRLRREVKAIEAEKARVVADADRARAAHEADARRANEDRAAALGKLTALREELRNRPSEAGEIEDLREALAARDLALGEAVQGRARIEEQVADLTRTVERQARELAELTASGVADPRAAQLAGRAAEELRRSEREAADLAAALRRSQDARAEAEAELERTKRDLARMKARKEHLENRIRTELGG
ncbi:hypothetical protein [Jannaschia formosa]|uniref:hypothetical protein n=1 Tax=Jannaschia formosa TaxID=2259592 RepID=UPI000E1B8867|nr:hypothetical protein [Jannaschia formosa]TFL17146.1 hypothetical protein DR046_16545 [Jannaschia formosa]